MRSEGCGVKLRNEVAGFAQHIWIRRLSLVGTGSIAYGRIWCNLCLRVCDKVLHDTSFLIDHRHTVLVGLL